MRRWIERLKSKGVAEKIESAPVEINSQGLVSLTGKELINQNQYRINTVKHIRRSLSLTQEAWENHYLFAIHRFAEVVQEHPASKLHHHSRNGGLLDHTLEVVLKAVRLSAGYILPPGAEPEEIYMNDSRWRFGIFIAALLHDVGKIISDQETVYKDSNGRYVKWQAWNGHIPFGCGYVYRYRETNGENFHGLHEKVGITLMPLILTPAASDWLSSDRRLLSQIMNTLSVSATGAGVVGEIIRKADRASTAEDLDPSTGVNQAEEKPLHIKILEGLQSLAGEGNLKRNLPGAALWVTEEYTFVVAKSVMEQVRNHLLASGHKGIPQSPTRLMQILNEHKHTVRPSEEFDACQAIVNDTQRSWKQKLSFLIFPNETIWVSGVPNIFSGEIIPVDNKGNELSINGQILSDPETVESNENDSVQDENAIETSRGYSVSPNSNPMKNADSNSEDPLPKANTISAQMATTDDNSETKPVELKANPKGQGTKPALRKKGSTGVDVSFKNLAGGKKMKASSRSPESLKVKHDFFRWLLNGIKYRRIRLNESGAMVHIVDKKVLLVTPKIFDYFLDDNKPLAMALGSERDSQLNRLQTQIKKLEIHIKKESYEDFHRIAVRGPRKESTFNAILIDRNKLPELDEFSENSMLEILEE